MRALSNEGFTIIELMVVIAIIGIMFAMVAPAVTSAMADGRAADAAVDIARLANSARSGANATGRAHVLVYDAFQPQGGIGGNQEVGRMRLFRDEANSLTSCNPASRWDFPNLNPIDEVDMRHYNIANSSHWITLEPVTVNNVEVTGTNVIDQICIQPDGRMMIRNSSDTNFGDSVNSVSSPIYAVFHKLSGTLSGVPRQVVFVFGGNARVRR